MRGGRRCWRRVVRGNDVLGDVFGGFACGCINLLGKCLVYLMCFHCEAHAHTAHQHATACLSIPCAQSSNPLSSPCAIFWSPKPSILHFRSSISGAYASRNGSSITTLASFCCFKYFPIACTSQGGCWGEYSGSAASMTLYFSSSSTSRGRSDQSSTPALALPPLCSNNVSFEQTLARRLGKISGRSVR